jgi:hypothetical protein
MAGPGSDGEYIECIRSKLQLSVAVHVNRDIVAFRSGDRQPAPLSTCLRAKVPFGRPGVQVLFVLSGKAPESPSVISGHWFQVMLVMITCVVALIQNFDRICCQCPIGTPI